MAEPRLCLYYRIEPERDRWVWGDGLVRPVIRRMIRGAPRAGGLDKVLFNLCLGLDRLGISYQVNLPFHKLIDNDRVGVLGRGRYSLLGYHRPNPIVAGIGLMTHPSEWPTLCEDYPVVRYLQHSEWANRVYEPYFGNRCAVWPVGIDTDTWCPLAGQLKSVDFLIYDKIHWDYEGYSARLMTPILASLVRRGLTFEVMRYGSYEPDDYRRALQRCRGMIFLCEHESQGLAYQECLASNIPILAWDQGWYLDPKRFEWGAPEIPATSVPYFDERCGEKFNGIEDFDLRLDQFVQRLNREEYQPRAYILENLTLENCARRFLEILEESSPS